MPQPALENHAASMSFCSIATSSNRAAIASAVICLMFFSGYLLKRIIPVPRM